MAMYKRKMGILYKLLIGPVGSTKLLKVIAVINQFLCNINIVYIVIFCLRKMCSTGNKNIEENIKIE